MNLRELREKNKKIKDEREERECKEITERGVGLLDEVIGSLINEHIEEIKQSYVNNESSFTINKYIGFKTIKKWDEFLACCWRGDDITIKKRFEDILFELEREYGMDIQVGYSKYNVSKDYHWNSIKNMFYGLRNKFVRKCEIVIYFGR